MAKYSCWTRGQPFTESRVFMTLFHYYLFLFNGILACHRVTSIATYHSTSPASRGHPKTNLCILNPRLVSHLIFQYPRKHIKELKKCTLNKFLCKQYILFGSTPYSIWLWALKINDLFLVHNLNEQNICQSLTHNRVN